MIRCDECDQLRDGYVPEEGMTAGVYFNWSEFTDKRIICDSCMWKNPKYIKIYGVVSHV